jgi:hypothetical protein
VWLVGCRTQSGSVPDDGAEEDVLQTVQLQLAEIILTRSPTEPKMRPEIGEVVLYQVQRCPDYLSDGYEYQANPGWLKRATMPSVITSFGRPLSLIPHSHPGMQTAV